MNALGAPLRDGLELEEADPKNPMVGGAPESVAFVCRDGAYIGIIQPLFLTDFRELSVVPDAQANTGIADPEAAVRSRVQASNGRRRRRDLRRVVLELVPLGTQEKAVGGSAPDSSLGILCQGADGAAHGRLSEGLKFILVKFLQAGWSVDSYPQVAGMIQQQ